MLFRSCAQGAAAQPVQFTVAADRPGPVIARQLYGQFTEHLGQGVYGGLWVGPGSAIPNVRGWRQDVVQALKRLQVPVLRWPGGCFADEYHWRDGIGPRARRPVRINGNWGGVAEPNAVGSHEFFDLVEQLGAEAYLTGNLGSGSTQEMAEWLEYLTADGPSSLARERRRNGRAQPFRVHYFGVGNESWGCGGNMRPEHYVDLYRQTTTFLKTPADRAPKFIASGGFEQDTTWAEVLSRDIRGVFEDIGPKMAGISHHAYTFPGGDFAHKGPATGFGTADWVSTLRNPQRIGQILTQLEAKLDAHDPKGRLGLYLDEWGAWYDPEPGTPPGFLVQRNTLRDALLAALHFHVFHEHAQRLRMANVAQMVNVLQAMVVTDGPRMLLTPTYHAFELYKPFHDATSLPTELRGQPELVEGGHRLPAISASAARARDGRLVVSLVNADPRQAHRVRLDVRGEAVGTVQGRVLTADAMDAHNSFARPDRVQPRALATPAGGDPLQVELPPMSVAVLTLGR